MSSQAAGRLSDVDLLRGPLPPWSERRVITLASGEARPYLEADWRDSLVIIERGTIDIECLAGSHRAFGPGDLLWLVGLPLRTLRNLGPGPTVLVAISRRPPTVDSYGRVVAGSDASEGFDGDELHEPHPALRRVLRGISTASPSEAADVAAALWVAETGDPWSRSSPLHVTCSALVVHPPTKRVLLRWHERQQSWLQVGGHADPGETDPFEIARREAVEETGLPDLDAWPGPAPEVLHVVVVPVPAGKGEPDHEHADLRYLLATDRPEAIVEESASAPLRWLTLAEARELTTEDNLRETLARAGRLLVTA
jgi:8-oxo-dGTP pyrophosphatase MutT (NUDIX family)